MRNSDFTPLIGLAIIPMLVFVGVVMVVVGMTIAQSFGWLPPNLPPLTGPS